MRWRAAAAALALWLSVGGVAFAQGYAHSTIALSGQTAPDTGGGVYGPVIGEYGPEYPHAPSINAAGDVTFTIGVHGGTVDSGVFVVSQNTHRAAALAGDPAPGLGGGTYDLFLDPAINAAGYVVFLAVNFLESFGSLYVDSGGIDTDVVRIGETAPGTGGGTYDKISFPSVRPPLVNDSGDVAFSSTLIGGTASSGIFVASGGTDTAAALSGDPAPGTGGGVYTSFTNHPGINASGDVAFTAGIAGGSAPSGVFVDSDGTDSLVALEGDTAPETGGSIFSAGLPGGTFGSPVVNDAGDVAFVALLEPITTFFGISVNSGGTTRVVALEGDPAPGTDSTYLVMLDPSINESGRVAFEAWLQGGSYDWGVFKATPASATPMLGMHGLAVARAALAIAGVVTAARRR
jgi:hypothetical protein